jgi:hypothetical protein
MLMIPSQSPEGIEPLFFVGSRLEEARIKSVVPFLLLYSATRKSVSQIIDLDIRFLALHYLFISAISNARNGCFHEQKSLKFQRLNLKHGLLGRKHLSQTLEVLEATFQRNA